MSPAVRATLGALALTLAACGGSSPQDLLEQAPDAMEAQGTVGYQQGVMVTDEAGEILLDTTTEGQQNLETGAQRMAIHLGETAPGAAGDEAAGDEAAGDEAAGEGNAPAELGGQTLEVLLDGTIAYVHSPQLEAVAGAPWARFDLTDTAEMLPGFNEAVEDTSGPLALMHELRGAVDEIEELGEEEVRGVATQHLRVTVDVQRAVDNAPEGRREQLRAAAEELGVPDRYPMEVWIDGDALPRRIVTVIETTDPNFGAITREMRTDLFDYGEPVDVTPPDEDAVVDFSELLSLLGSFGDAGS